MVVTGNRQVVRGADDRHDGDPGLDQLPRQEHTRPADVVAVRVASLSRLAIEIEGSVDRWIQQQIGRQLPMKLE
jgi:hypothetical protein